MGEPGTVIDFDRAEYGPSQPAVAPCTNCKRPIEGQYWKFRAGAVCRSCRDGIEAAVARATSGASLARAAVEGGGVALACGVGYAAFAAASHMQIALVTIGIGFVVAKVVRRASGGVGGVRFQVLAVALTYVASTMGYLPPIWNAFDEPHVGTVVGLALRAPFLEATHEPIGLLIVGFGLWEAWKLTKGVPIVLEGPFRMGPGTGASPSP
jgi:hypothetical protein